jgi:hypothetical protein
MALDSGTRLGPYEILAPLGAGGMGQVYRARDTRLDRSVAIKVLPADTTSAHAFERFEREAKAIAALNHPGICAIYDIGSSPVPFLVMELLDGETLHQRIAASAHPLPCGRPADHGRGVVGGWPADCRGAVLRHEQYRAVSGVEEADALSPKGTSTVAERAEDSGPAYRAWRARGRKAICS